MKSCFGPHQDVSYLIMLQSCSYCYNSDNVKLLLCYALSCIIHHCIDLNTNTVGSTCDRASCTANDLGTLKSHQTMAL